MKTITNRQFIFLLIVFITSTADILLPSITVQLAGRDAWLSVLAAAVAGSFIVFIQAKLAQRFPGQSPVDYAQSLLGPTLGKLVILLYLFFILYVTTAVIGEVIQISNSVFFLQSPVIMTSLLLSLAAGYAVFLGIEVIARVVEFVFIPGILMRAIIIVTSLGDVELLRYQPVLEQGLGSVLQGSFRVMGWLGEGVILLFLSQYIQSPVKFTRSMLTVIWAVALLLLLTSLTIGTFGPQQAEIITFPLLESIRMVQIGAIRGLEAFVMVFWYSAIFFKAAVLYYVLLVTIQNLTMTRLKSTFLVPLAALLIILPVDLFADISGTLDFLKNIWPGFAITFELFFPLGLLLLAVFKKQGCTGEA